MTTLFYVVTDRKEVDSGALALGLCNSQFMLQKPSELLWQNNNMNILSHSQIFRSAGVA